MSPDSPNSYAATLATLIRNELSRIPVERWRDLFPAYVALWRFIEQIHPDALGPVRAGYDTEPYFDGKGAHWFTGTLLQDERILEHVESIMYDMVDALRDLLPGRDSLELHEIPEPRRDAVQCLADVVLERVKDALASGVL
jgi:hypothetical protein